MPEVKFNHEKEAVVSTAHMTEHDNILLSTLEIPSVDRTDFGFRICLPCDDTVAVIDKFIAIGFSHAFITLLQALLKDEAVRVLFDADAALNTELVQFNW